MNLTKLERKKFRVRNKVKKVSSKDRYRLSVNRSTKNISAQIIDESKKEVYEREEKRFENMIIY